MVRKYVIASAFLASIVLIGCGGVNNDEAGQLEFSEILYHAGSGDSLEYIEIHNRGDAKISLSGVELSGAASYTFADSAADLEGDAYLVLTNDQLLFQSRFPGVSVAGVYSGRMSNSGENLQLATHKGKTLAVASYSQGQFWPVMAKGAGYSLVLVGDDAQQASAWKSSAVIGGTPGAANEAAPDMVVTINEVMPASAETEGWIELANSSSAAVDIGGWWLTDSLQSTTPVVLVAGTQIPANGFLLVRQPEWNGTLFPAVTGDHLFLVRTQTSNATGSASQLIYPALDSGSSAGLSLLSDGALQVGAQAVATPGAANGNALVGPLVITQINYNPLAGEAEFVEITNNSDSEVLLADATDSQYAWKMEGIDVTIPPGAVMDAHAKVLFVRSKDADTAAFRAAKSISASVQIFGFTGKLANEGETLVLKKPGAAILTDGGLAAYSTGWSDVVHYQDSLPWPVDANGLGKSLQRVDLTKAGSDPSAWAAAGPDPL